MRLFLIPYKDIFSNSASADLELRNFTWYQLDAEDKLVSEFEKTVYRENRDLFYMYVPKSRQQADEIRSRKKRKIVIPGDPHFYQKVRFLRNFHEGDFNRENSFFISHPRLFGSSPRSQPQIIGRIIKKTGYNKASVEIINSHGKLKTIEVYIYVYARIFHGDFYFDIDMTTDNHIFEAIYQGSPQLEEVFAAFKSTRKSVDSSLLKIPSRSHEGQKLKDQGYSAGYTRGMDEVNEWLAVREQLIELKVNPFKTHVDYFADKMRTLIEYARKAKVVQSLPDDSTLLQELKRLEKRVEQVIFGKKFTYTQLLRFSKALVGLLDHLPEEEYAKAEDSDVLGIYFTPSWEHEYNQRLSGIHFFPADIFMPVTQGQIGIMALNTSSSQGVHALGLIIKPQMTDGEKMSPSLFFSHDIDHAETWMDLNNTYSGKLNGKFYEELLKTQGLPIEKRKKIEFAYFMLTHENRYGQFAENSPEEIRKYLISKIKLYKNVEQAIKLQLISDGVAAEYLQQIESIADDFVEFFSQIKNSGTVLTDRANYISKIPPSSHTGAFELPEFLMAYGMGRKKTSDKRGAKAVQQQRLEEFSGIDSSKFMSYKQTREITAFWHDRHICKPEA